MTDQDKKAENDTQEETSPEVHMASPYDAALMNPYGMGAFGAGGMADFGFSPAAEEGTQAKAGYELEEGSETAEADDLIAALRTVHDPEIPVNIYDLGLIYDCTMQDGGNVDITMTLTAPACPVAGEMPGQVAQAVADVDGVGEVTVTLTWEPPWRQDMMSEDAMLAMDLF
ncbi:MULTISPECIES: DUF59 domain-containing protein [Curvivirga]|uniref:DUF59 domain-containing protein n=1 Tax=Curvivirga TaxID=2856846 RepID=UPI001F4703EE|nr:DUF59 domain-containing protein [Curvivirga aplysinae]